VKRLLVFLALLPAACATDFGGDGSCGDGFDCDTGLPLAVCEANVVGQSTTIAVEDVYLPGVVACENPAAPPAALRAQAIAARSFLYQVMAVEGKVKDSEFGQVFSCKDPKTGQPKLPRQEHLDAVAATSGQVLMYKGTLVAGMYAAGALQEGPTCTGGGTDPTGTEWAITYNQGKSGDEISQTRLGSISKKNYANRGAMSQNGANCLADNGYTTDQILHFYYGDDIELVQATGDCVNAGPSVQAEDVGEICSGDATCDATCQTWFLPTVNQSFGMCSAECTGACPEGSACVALATGQNRCAPVPSPDNNYCEAIPGTVPRVLEQFGAGGWQSVCATPAVGTKCTAGGQKGECMDANISSCSGGHFEPNVCPGGGSIQCCIR